MTAFRAVILFIQTLALYKSFAYLNSSICYTEAINKQ